MAPKKKEMKKSTNDRTPEFDILGSNVTAKSLRLYDFEDHQEVVTSANGTDLVELTYDNLPFYINQSYDNRQAFLIYGDPGLGKSTVAAAEAMEIAKRLDREFVNWQKIDIAEKKKVLANISKYFVFVDIRTAQLEPSDLVGIPNIAGKEEYLEMLPQKWVYTMCQEGSAGILFLDEINQGSPQVLKALFQVVLDRGVGNMSFTDAWGIVAAGNLGTQFNNEIIPPALTNRYMAGVLKADAEAWMKYADEHDVDELIIAFVESRPEENFYRAPEQSTSNQFPSPRQFFALSKQIEYIKGQYLQLMRTGKRPVQSIYKTVGDSAAMLCGANWAQRFITFCRYQKMYDWDTIVRECDSIITEKDIDKNHAVVLVARDQLIRVFGEESKTKDDDARLQFAEDFCKVFVCFNKEFRMVLFNRINNKAKFACAEFLSVLFNNKKKEPFSKVLPHFVEAGKLGAGEFDGGK